MMGAGISRRSLQTSISVAGKYRYGPNDITPKVIPRFDRQAKAANIRATGENHNMRVTAFSKQRADYLQRGAALDDFAEMKGKFGIVATQGLRLHHQYMKAMELALNRFLNLPSTKAKEMGMHAYFRIPDPWYPVTKHVECATAGGGKGKIHYWCTPVRARTVILEVDCDDEVEFFHVYQGLQDAIDAVEGPENKKLARFPLVKDSMIPMSRENLKKIYEEERKIEMANENFFTRREMFAKNMMGLRNDKTRWNHTMGQPIFWSQTEHGAASQMDQHYFGKYR